MLTDLITFSNHFLTRLSAWLSLKDFRNKYKNKYVSIYAWLVAHKICTFFLWFQDLEQHLQHLEALMITQMQGQIKVKNLCFFPTFSHGPGFSENRFSCSLKFSSQKRHWRLKKTEWSNWPKHNIRNRACSVFCANQW